VTFKDAEPDTLTEESFLELVRGMIHTTPAMPDNVIMVSVPMANRMERGWRRSDACRILKIDPGSVRAKKITVKRSRWPE
jgi:hypothetical protein